MYIKDAIYKPVRIKAPLPLAEGAVLTLGGNIASEDGSDAYGVVPHRVTVLPPSKKINIAVAGTIDLTENKNVTFSDNMIAGLHEFNFVPYAEPEPGGGGGVPALQTSDVGKILTAVESPDETVTVRKTVIPDQTITVSSWQFNVDPDEFDVSGFDYEANNPVTFVVDGAEYVGKYQRGKFRVNIGSSQLSILSDGTGTCSSLSDGDHTLSAYADVETPKVIPAWSDSGIPTPTAEDAGKVPTVGADGTVSWETPSGGGGIPAPTSSNVGKALVVESSEDSTVIVPSQTVTVTQTERAVALQNADTDYLMAMKDGDTATIIVGDIGYDVVARWGADGAILNLAGNNDDYEIAYLTREFEGIAAGVYYIDSVSAGNKQIELSHIVFHYSTAWGGIVLPPYDGAGEGDTLKIVNGVPTWAGDK